MNERIKELLSQAGFDPFGIERMGVMPQTEKFVELIIRECIVVHEDDYGIDIIGDALKHHFGVEQ